LTAGNRVIRRQEGLIAYQTMVSWFESLGCHPENTDSQDDAKALPRTRLTTPRVTPSQSMDALPDTVRKGTATPANAAERKALAATVRLKVEDSLGVSYATGTVIHRVENESLVLTCGHVFRDSQGHGKITAELGFLDGSALQVPGKLVQYDADDRDIGLVAIQTRDIEPIQVAPQTFPVARGDQIFSIGCDHGESPTIRRSRIKNQARYNGVDKYDIFGRPVVGRSGGGLFTPGGQLIGVCNAAVVDVDEGVYTTLDTIYWQIARANLSEFFDDSNRSAVADLEPITPRRKGAAIAAESTASAIDSPRSTNSVDLGVAIPASRLRNDGFHPTPAINTQTDIPEGENSLVNNGTSLNDQQSWQHSQNTEIGPDGELIVIYRSRSTGTSVQAWTIRNPSTQLLDRLQDAERAESEQRNGSLARLRREMPDLTNRQPGSSGNAKFWKNVARAQSPK
jgi:hypothetical protein